MPWDANIPLSSGSRDWAVTILWPPGNGGSGGGGPSNEGILGGATGMPRFLRVFLWGVGLRFALL